MIKKIVLTLHLLTLPLLANELLSEGNLLYKNREFTKAAAIFEKACVDGIKEACNNYAVMLATGQGVNVDLLKAVELYVKSCDEKNGDGCYNAGAILINHSEIISNFSDIIKLFENACELENSEGCYNLGVIYTTGINVNINKDIATNYFKKACEISDENSKACLNAGVNIYEDNLQDATKYFQKACDKNNYLGCYNLGISWIKFATTISELVSAKAMLEHACKNEEKIACEASEDIENAIKLLSQ